MIKFRVVGFVLRYLAIVACAAAILYLYLEI